MQLDQTLIFPQTRCDLMNVTIIAGLLTVITLALGVFMAVQMIQAVTPPMPPTAGDVGKGAIKHAADLLRQKATEIQNNGVCTGSSEIKYSR